MNEGLVTMAYLVSGVFFVLSLGGLSNQETARRGNLYGIIGMTLAILATFLGGQVENFKLLIPLMLGGALIGAILAKRVEMTSMPELVAILHSFVGLAAVLVGMASFLDPGHTDLVGALKGALSSSQSKRDAGGILQRHRAKESWSRRLSLQRWRGLLAI